MKNKDRITYTLKHRKAFRQVEKQLLGHNTIRSLFHDLDKVILYNFFDYKAVHNFHRKHTRHHELKHIHIMIMCNGNRLGMCKIYKAR